MRQVGWAERQIRRAGQFWQHHPGRRVPAAVVQKFGNAGEDPVGSVP
jgi:hypothetical protein